MCCLEIGRETLGDGQLCNGRGFDEEGRGLSKVNPYIARVVLFVSCVCVDHTGTPLLQFCFSLNRSALKAAFLLGVVFDVFCKPSVT